MSGLTSFGIFHTAISLIAVGAGIVALVRQGAIRSTTWIGKVYVITTAASCLTGLAIFHHGGFGAQHGLAVVTLVMLAGALLAGTSRVFGRVSPYIETVGYSVTLFFHFIPGVTETVTRLPVGTPLASDPNAPVIQAAIGCFFFLFSIVAWWQVRRLRAATSARRTED